MGVKFSTMVCMSVASADVRDSGGVEIVNFTAE